MSFHLIYVSSGCFGCFTKPNVVTAIDGPSKGLKFQGHVPNKPSVSDGFWSSSTYDMDLANTSNRTTNPTSTNADMTNHPEFVNQGLTLSDFEINYEISAVSTPIPLDITYLQHLIHFLVSSIIASVALCSWDATYESLLNTNRPFPRPIPLPEVVDLLVDKWEQEGLYD
ncbi:protein of unknown function DUF4050 [Dillenia turbinata]|uniref:Gag1-like clamp domain-containing protein n=1 Tax=Dillenia turbinata TaxID=194707 RepID=A0AAN8V9Q8_9MAGN